MKIPAIEVGVYVELKKMRHRSKPKLEGRMLDKLLEGQVLCREALIDHRINASAKKRVKN